MNDTAKSLNGSSAFCTFFIMRIVNGQGAVLQIGVAPFLAELAW